MKLYLMLVLISLQIHRLEDGTLAVYSRNSENMSGRYPDVVEKLNKVMICLDGS